MSDKTQIPLIDFFLHAYFYFLEQSLNRDTSWLKNLKFQSEESNTDEYLKKFLQDFISKNNQIGASDIDKVIINIDGINYQVSLEDLTAFKIIEVFLPEQLSESDKISITQSKESIYTNPDLYLIIDHEEEVFHKSIELKSTKQDKISGSSVQQVNPFEWVIFIQRKDSKEAIATGYYIDSITEKLPFPDRSPRPQIAFSTLKKWNNNFRIKEDKVLIIHRDSSLLDTKMLILRNWHEYLANEWLEIIQAEEIKKNEKWFNNTLRIFALKYLDYVESLNEDELENLKKQLDLLIKK